MWFGISSACSVWSNGENMKGKPIKNMAKIVLRMDLSKPDKN